MKTSVLRALGLFFLILMINSCDKKTAGPECNEITLNQTFTAKINEQWCLEDADLKIRFGPFLEDSRCNVPNIDCVWAGRYVMGTTIDTGTEIQDTFYAVHNWTDTLYHNSYRIILAKVYPEIRTSMEPLDDSAYSFDVIVKQ